ncbi:MAG: 50S ribosomal protein L5 [Tepidisphaeraceae bacterium]
MAKEQDKAKAAAKAKAAGEKAQAAAKARKSGPGFKVADGETTYPKIEPRLAKLYKDKIAKDLQQQFGYTNLMATPKLTKIVISMGLGKAVVAGEKAKLDTAEKELAIIAGQKPVRCKAKKSVAQFKVREGMETGLKVTLRGERMYEFLDRMISLAFPRVKDFRGMSANGFDKTGNYNFGFNEQTVFPELAGTDVTFQQGMNVTVVTTGKTAKESRELLKAFGFPFKTDEKIKD